MGASCKGGVRLGSRKGQTVPEGPEQQGIGVRRPTSPCPITPGTEGPKSQLAPQAEGMLPPTLMGSSRVTDLGTEAAGEAMA